MPEPSEGPDRTGRLELDILPTAALLGKKQARAARRGAGGLPQASDAPRGVFKDKDSTQALSPIEDAPAFAPAPKRKAPAEPPPADEGLDISLNLPGESSAVAEEPAAAEAPLEDSQQEQSASLSFPQLSDPQAEPAAEETPAQEQSAEEQPAEEQPAEEPAQQEQEAPAEVASQDDSQPIQEKPAPAADEDDILRPSGKGPVWPV